MKSRAAYRLFRISLGLAPALGFCQPAAPGPRPPTIRTTGEATASAKPDRARLDIGVVTQASTAEAAAHQNGAQVDTVIARMKQALGSHGEVRTVNYSLNPNYHYPREGGGTPTITGYTASNTVEVTVDDLSGLGKLIDTATESGANNIQRLQFSLRDEQAVRAQALREAALRARADANALAAALGLRIVKVVSVEEGSSGNVQPVRMMAMAAAAGPSTPVEPGTVEVRAVVSLVVEVQ